MLLIESVDRPPAAAALFRQISSRAVPAWLDANVDRENLGRFSFLAADPFLKITAYGERIIEENCLNGEKIEHRSPFFPFLDRLQQRWQRPKESGFLPFESGLIGYLGYELGHQVETFTQTTENDLKMPDAFFAAYDALIAIDHLNNTTWLVASGLPEAPTSPAAADRARQRLEELRELVMAARKDKTETGSMAATHPKQSPQITSADGDLKANFSYASYRAAIEKILNYIAAGDIYQVNLSQRFATSFTGSYQEFYLHFRNLSPAPFGAYLETGAHCIMSNSPERYLLIKDDYIETRPIKGTRPRGATAFEDAELARQLLASPKDRAEHIMIVDLERNDLGRVAAYGSVHVPEMQILESYANVHHMVSTVAARIRPGKSSSECLLNSFPGGSITGAPKLRSMEIIDELEPTCRGVYTGSIGYFDFSGDLDFNIAIRTAVAYQDHLYFQVGGGIVADSDPDDEYQETRTKAASFLKALQKK
ncbi:MAG: aminodeoxychorismate synthase component I [Deltaproteobacteria bacterium]|nr:aminodeoxychorismate synthase component I [Deltaproteobacteria bacterium]